MLGGQCPQINLLTQCCHVSIPADFVEIDELIVKFIWKYRGPRIANAVLRKVNKIGVFIRLHFKTLYKVMVMKTVWNWHKFTVESPEIKP